MQATVLATAVSTCFRDEVRRFPHQLSRYAALIALMFVVQGCGDAASGDAGAMKSAAHSTSDAPAVAPLPALTGEVSVAPLDEALRDPALVATRDSLLAIVARRDTAALLTYLDPAVKYSFGGDEGRDGFLQFWRTQYSMDALWRTLYDVLMHGGRFMGPALFSAPWTFSALPDSLDAFTHLVIRDALVPVRLAPADTASPIGTLSYAAVRIAASEVAPEDSTWRPIALSDGRTAYVQAASVRSPVDWRVGLGRHNGRWVIQYFVAGD